MLTQSLHTQQPLFLLRIILLLVAFAGSQQALGWDTQNSPAGNPARTSSACASCHAAQAAQWQGSHHALAMQPASSARLLGDFAAKVQEGPLSATFGRQKDGAAWVELTEGAAPASKHEVLYAFGVEPLQQYLVAAPGGRMQVLPFAWDTRLEAEGGQRWYTLFAPEQRPPNDRFHWLQPLQNWNGMCADCHATNLQRAYDASKDEFDTAWQEGNVGCLACHNPEQPIQTRAYATSDHWQRAPGAATANRRAGARATQDRAYMDTCAGCHSLRTPLTPSVQAGDRYQDHYRLGLLEPNLYHPDGQIKEEVYVWGSFLQSKMYAQGVGCGDCHNPHSLGLRKEGDALCGQCHAASEFAQPQHHGHLPGSVGSQCVNCHMPETTYMGVDARRDHKFVVPRPHLPAELAVPNACANCHADRGDAWAAQVLQRLHGKAEALTASQRAVLASQRLVHPNEVAPLSLPALSLLVADASLPEITRASVLTQQARLQRPGQAPVSVANLAQLAAGESALGLLRLAALDVAKTLPAAQRLRVAQASLVAPYRSVRIAAADALLGVPLPTAIQPAFDAAMVELQQAQVQTAWRGEGRMNLALTQLRLGNVAAAEQHYLQSIAIDPYFAPAYVNLADVYRQQQRSLEAAAFYPQALQAVPKSAELRYSYALHLVRAKQLEQALVESKRALALAPDDPQMATLYLLVLDGLGRTREGLLWLQSRWSDYDAYPSVRQLGLSLAGKIQDLTLLQWFRQRAAGR